MRLVDAVPEHVTLTFADATEGAMFLIATAGHVISERDRLTLLKEWNPLQDRLANLVIERDDPCDDGIEVRLGYLMATAAKPRRNE